MEYSTIKHLYQLTASVLVLHVKDWSLVGSAQSIDKGQVQADCTCIISWAGLFAVTQSHTQHLHVAENDAIVHVDVTEARCELSDTPPLPGMCVIVLFISSITYMSANALNCMFSITGAAVYCSDT